MMPVVQTILSFSEPDCGAEVHAAQIIKNSNEYLIQYKGRKKLDKPK